MYCSLIKSPFSVYHLGIFSDFFDFIGDFLSNIVRFFNNLINGIIHLFEFLTSFMGIIAEPLGWLPPILSTIAFLGIIALVLHFVLELF